MTTPSPQAITAITLDPGVCRQARLARDPRFDGEFFLGVRTTGIYCRPICPARAPAEANVHYFRTAAEAAAAGYRPCLRCRPESTPGSPAWLGTATTVRRALRLIEQGALNGGSLPDLAARLGVGERYLRKLFERKLGASPLAVALNHRLLFARKLLAETDLTITEIAYAAGFGSVRRFNDAVRAQFRQSPRDLRAKRGRRPAGAITLHLQYRPPYDWDGVIGFFRRHALDGLEEATAAAYRRRLLLDGRPASFRVAPARGRHALRLELDLPEPRQMMPMVATVRRMFDLDAHPAVIADTLGRDPVLSPLLAARPGVRAPGYWSLYEAAVRAVVGQQVSTAAARGICSRLARAAGEPGHPVFPRPAALAAIDDSQLPMPGRRRSTVRRLGELAAAGPLHLEELAELPGVGPWTVAMAAQRGAGEPDAFPATDLGLVRAWERLAGPGRSLGDHLPRWRPWRSYAANLLWRSLDP